MFPGIDPLVVRQGDVFLNDVEIQYIVENLFVCNRLSMVELVTSDGTRIDLRHIRSPILCFCSIGDNISPPPQALGWITDLYLDDDDVRAHDQTIITRSMTASVISHRQPPSLLAVTAKTSRVPSGWGIRSKSRFLPTVV